MDRMRTHLAWLTVLGLVLPAARGQERPEEEMPPVLEEDDLAEYLESLAETQRTPGGSWDHEIAPAIHLHRAADPVVVTQGATRRTLQYWDPHLLLNAGDVVRQGQLSRTLLDFPDGTRLMVDGSAVLWVDSSAEDLPHRLELGELHAFASLRLSSNETRVRLPGGNMMVGRDARVSVRQIDERVLSIRNSGPEALTLRSPFLGDRSLRLGPGQRVLLPDLELVGRLPSGPLQELTAGASGVMPARLSPEVSVQADGDEVVLSGLGPGQGRASVAGARLRLAPGQSLRLRRAPWPQPVEE